MIVQLTRGYTMECNPETYFRFVMTIGSSLCINNTGYAVYRYKSKLHLFHRWVMNCTDPTLQVSHINANSLNNWESNLVIGTQSQNLRNQNDRLRYNNTSGHRGIYWNQFKRKWHCRISVNHNSEHLGYFDTLEQAIEARAKAEIKYGFVPKVASVLG